MTLYNCKSHGEAFTITKFDDDLNPQATYQTTWETCDCPAGHRSICRHRTMLEDFVVKGRVDTLWFWDFELETFVDPTGQAEAVGDILQHADFQVADIVTGRLSAKPWRRL